MGSPLARHAGSSFDLSSGQAGLADLVVGHPEPYFGGMNRVAVDSTSVASVGYDERKHVLEIEFRGGRVYRYLDVPAAVHRLLLRAPSIVNSSIAS